MTKQYEWDDEILIEADAEAEPVIIHEDEADEPQAEPVEPKEEPEGEPEGEPQAEPQAAVEEPAESEPGLTAAQVQTRFTERKLMQAMVNRLSGRTFANMAELDAAIEAEVAYAKALTESGRPFGLGHSAAPVKDRATLLSERDAALSEINKKYLG